MIGGVLMLRKSCFGLMLCLSVITCHSLYSVFYVAIGFCTHVAFVSF